MNKELEYIFQKFEITPGKPPIEIFKTNRIIMAQTIKELGYRRGAEVGVAQGHHSELFCKENPELELYCIDVWGRYKGYLEYTDRIDKYYLEAQERLKPYNATLIKKFSMDAVKDFADRSLDFVYIDGAHDFQNVANDICEWIKKIRPGGMIYGHDYERNKSEKYQQHVVDVVCAYTYSHKINPWFILGEKGRADGIYKEGIRQWMWIIE